MTRQRRRFTREFKLEALRRFAAAGDLRELGVRRELLYKWREKFAQGGAAALTTSGRPRPSGQSAQALSADQRTAGVSRAAYYRRWTRTSPAQEETRLRDVIQRLALGHRFYGYRRITNWCGATVNRKRIARIMREDNLTSLFTPQWPYEMRTPAI